MNYRQGDVSLHPIEKPDLSKLTKVELKGRLVLAYGEKSGHNHAILDRPDTGKFEVYKDAQGRFVLNILSPVTLAHVMGDTEEKAEHDKLTIQPGWYIQEQEEEYDYFAMANKRVVD